MSRPESETPTDWELTLLGILWEQSPLKVDDIREVLRSRRIKRSDSALRTILRIMGKKGLVKTLVIDRVTHYEPGVTRPLIEKRYFRHISRNLFKGNQDQFIMRLLDESQISDNVLEKMKRMIEQHQPDDVHS